MMELLGTENALAVRGTILHMVNHSMIKLILFMAAGVVYRATGCALGSQTWSGNIPALAPKPNSMHNPAA